MLRVTGHASLTDLIDKTIPESIRLRGGLELPASGDEASFLKEAAAVAAKNKVNRSYLGLGYHGCIVPPVIQRNILENPGWYTQYTPYQAEIAQGRLEALLNFQTMVIELTGMEIANASLLDEGTAAAEAMTLFLGQSPDAGRKTMILSQATHPQTRAVVKGRAEPLDLNAVECGATAAEALQALKSHPDAFGLLLAYPGTDGKVEDLAEVIAAARAGGVQVAVVADLLALAILKPPGEMGADVVLGTSQRLGIPMGYGGPHAAFFASRESYKRFLPGRIIGVSVDAHGNRALRMALQTREQHIRREKATSNICTSQVLLAVMAGMYGVWHGPDGLAAIARRIHALARSLASVLEPLGYRNLNDAYFDTLLLAPPKGCDPQAAKREAETRGINIRTTPQGELLCALDESVSVGDLADLAGALAAAAGKPSPGEDVLREASARLSSSEGGVLPAYPERLQRTAAFMTHAVFHQHRSEHAMLRYIRGLERKDLSLTTSMIPLGSCTMKLNATAEMMPLSWPGFAFLHPFAPSDQAQGYAQIFGELSTALGRITGLPGVSLQPNAGSQGEYAGLLVIRSWQKARGHHHRDVCLIPASAHGTNPASAVMAGLKVVVVACDASGNIDLGDLEAKAKTHGEKLCALMVTYPSTHGVFEAGIRKACQIVHDRGGQVYMDGANLNAQVGLTSPAATGADVCHINLHKTFCIPHGGGGPGMGPICVAAHLQPHLPGHPLVAMGGPKSIPPVSSAPFGSASILTISWAYIRLMGGAGLTHATEVAILNANYLKARLEKHYPVLYVGEHGCVAHEMILDCRKFKAGAGIEVEDIAKRLIDYGFHAPTVSFPVPGTLMIDPTESEDRDELDRFAEALIEIRREIAAIEEGRMDRADNPLKNAPHTCAHVVASEWKHPYSREVAAYPLPWVHRNKFWPAVARLNNAYGDKNLVCSCPPMEEY